jgi:malate synthase
MAIHETTLNNITLLKPLTAEHSTILTPDALAFVALLHREFNPPRHNLLQGRIERQHNIDNGILPDFLPETAHIRAGQWQVAPTPSDLQDRRVEITGPVDRKMMINALNSGAKVFMADLEDSLSPTWQNVINGQVNLRDAVNRTIAFNNNGKIYELNDEIATLMVRPRGWHLVEKNILVDGESISASLFDFGLYFFHNIHTLVARNSASYFYLPKLESHLEARLWNDVFNLAQDTLGISRGTIRATVLIETILAAFEMQEILYELRDHSAGLNAGRWDYIFSVIKKFRNQPNLMLPDRGQITMNVPFMRHYTELLVKTCHERGAHAIGGMAAFIPNRHELEVTTVALNNVRADKERESGDGFDGTWVAHPDLVPVAMDVFDAVLGDNPHQKDRLREDVQIAASDLLNITVPDGTVTEAGVRLNISVALQYIAAWLMGSGAVAIFNLMEDAATAEISRAQLWQWLNTYTVLDDGQPFTIERYQQFCGEELDKLDDLAVYRQAATLLDDLVLAANFAEFLTISAYQLID